MKGSKAAGVFYFVFILLFLYCTACYYGGSFSRKCLRLLNIWWYILRDYAFCEWIVHIFSGLLIMNTNFKIINSNFKIHSVTQ